MLHTGNWFMSAMSSLSASILGLFAGSVLTSWVQGEPPNERLLQIASLMAVVWLVGLFGYLVLNHRAKRESNQ